MSQTHDTRLLVAVDVDGTLLDTEFEEILRTREIEALEAVRQAGHVLALCTGRNLNSTQRLLENSDWFPDDLPMVLLNGAVVWARNPRQVLSRKVLTGEQIHRLVRLFREHGTVPMVYGTDDDGGVLHHESRPVNDVLGRYLSVRREMVGAIHACEDLNELTWDEALEVGTIDLEEPVKALTAAVERDLPGQVKVINTRSLLGEGRYYWAEVFHGDTDKGAGLRVLAEEFGIPRERSVAIGDNYNDLDMFDAVDFRVAMGGSPDAVLARADLVVSSATESGAAQALEAIASGVLPPR